ncbi:PREDICTED: uncharacterized protein LOC101305412 [Fragaria vesca subsp. vesca]
MNHNTKVWDNEAKPTSEAVSSILGWYAEYREVHVSNNVPIPVPRVGWQKSGMVKLNVDAAFDNPNSLTGIGVIFRDADGIFLNGFQHSLPNAASLRHAELHALMLEYALSYHLVSLIVETDCQELVYAITGHSLDHFDLGFLISDLKQLLQQTDSAILCHVKREGNKNRGPSHSHTHILCFSAKSRALTNGITNSFSFSFGGKTLLAKTVARFVNVPFVITDATNLTQNYKFRGSAFCCLYQLLVGERNFSL